MNIGIRVDSFTGESAVVEEWEFASLYSESLNQDIELCKLEIYEVAFIPTEKHTLKLDRPIKSNAEVVEALMPDGLCHHNILKCASTGIVVDLTLGQFTGTMKPSVFPDMKSFGEALPGAIQEVHSSSELSIQQQISRDDT